MPNPAKDTQMPMKQAKTLALIDEILRTDMEISRYPQRLNVLTCLRCDFPASLSNTLPSH
jgi:hypothetical protein